MSSHYEKFLATGEVKCIDDEIPFEIPDGWEWTRLGAIFFHCTGKALNGTNKTGTLYKYITTSNLYWDRFELSHLKEMYFTNEELEKCTVLKGDLLVCEGGDIGRSAIWNYDFDMRIQNHIHKLRPYGFIATRFYYYAMLLYKSTGYIGGKGIGIQGLSSGALHNILLPLPPANEQVRIITRLEVIIPIVSQYEKRHDELTKLNTDVYIHLKKSILQEAIQGRLVPQNPEDEPASKLLERIREEKQKLLKAGKLKKKDITDSVIFRGDDNAHYEKVGCQVVDISEDIPFDLPSNWCWVRLRDICTIMTGATFKKDEVRHQAGHGVRVLRGGNIYPFEIKFKNDDIFLDSYMVKSDILLKQNDLITPAVTSLENICKMTRIDDDIDSTTVGGFVFIIRPLLNITDLSKYLLAVLSSPSLVEYVKSITNKSGQAFYNIGKERLGAALIPLPPLEEQNRINHEIDLLSNLLSHN